MRARTALLVIALLAATAPAAAAQEPSPAALVVEIGGDSRYHAPSCPLVARAGANVTMMRLSEATRRRLTPHDCEQAAAEQPKKDANAAPVYVQAGDKRYHKERCPKLQSEASRTTVGEAGKKYWPCPVCRPPIRKREKALER